MSLTCKDSKCFTGLKEPLQWQFSDIVRTAALRGTNTRGKQEISSVQKDSDIIRIHGEQLAGYLTYEQILFSFKFFARLVGYSFGDSTADLGSGTGVGACILSKIRGVKQVYAVEYAEAFVREVMPVVFRHFGAKTEKIQRVIGDFNHLQLEDQSLDVVVEIGAFHHSENLEKTLREVWRVMKPGALLVASERAHPDHVSDLELKKALDQELPNSLKQKYGISESASFTRRDWGEHEYRFSEWIDAMKAIGFDAAGFQKLCRPIHGIGRILKILPFLDPILMFSAIAYRKGRRLLRVWDLSETSAIFFAVKPRR